MKARIPLAAMALVLAATYTDAWAETRPMEEIVVTAELRPVDWVDAPLSVTVLDESYIRRNSVQHFEELIYRVPNLNLSRGSSRARFFQIRGIGRREEYTGAPNQAVGVMVDDIDFSGLGGAAVIFDAEQVEVLRGPQSTQLGANALAGLIKVSTREPSESFDLHADLDAGNDGLRGAGVAFGGPVADDAVRYRVALRKFESHGFRDNVFLGRDDTNGRDETLARIKLSAAPGERTRVDVTALFVDLDNGFDAFAIDNGFKTYSDRPGRDAQTSRVASVKLMHAFDGVTVESISTYGDHDVTYSFDGDWGNADFWGAFGPYDFFSASDRDRRLLQQDLRVRSAAGSPSSWLVGVFVRDTEEDFRIVDDFNGAVFRDLASEYRETSAALYGEIDVPVDGAWAAFAGARIEWRDSDYSDNAGPGLTLDDTRVGADVGLRYGFADGSQAYLSLNRGFRFGGFNVAAALRTETLAPEIAGLVAYDGENVTSVELGYKGEWPERRARGGVTAFYMRRSDFQELFPTQLLAGDPLSFVILTRNGGRADVYGIEAEGEMALGEFWTVGAGLGLLETEIDEFDGAPELIGRALPHAPDLTVTVGVELQLPGGWFARLDGSHRAGYFFDSTHDQRARSVTLLDARVGYEHGAWSVSLWGHNLSDEIYAERGFYFGNEPPDFAPKEYLQQSDRRAYGVNLSWRFL